MPNTVQHFLHPMVWALCIGVALFGATPFVIIACLALMFPLAVFSALPDLYGVWKGSSPGWGFQSDKGNWDGYVQAHHGSQSLGIQGPNFYDRHAGNWLYKFHLWQDRYSHGDPRYFLKIFKGTPEQIRAKQSLWNDIVNDIFIVCLLFFSVGWLWALLIVLACGLCLYSFKILSWRLHR